MRARPLRGGPLAALLLAPAGLLLGAVLAWPLLSAALLSVRDVRIVGSEGAFVGLANYREALADDATWRAAGLSLTWVLANAALQTALALGAALLLHQRWPGVRVARTWIVLAWIVPTVVVVMIWRWLLSTSGGMINPLLMRAGLTAAPVGFFSTPWGAFAALVAINSWRWFPFLALMILAGLTRIPRDLLEAARVDGAGPWRRFTRVTWPLLAPTLAVLFVVGTLLSFNVFDVIWLMTGGGPAGGTRTLPVLIYETAFRGYRISLAAALGVLSTLVLMAFAVLATRGLALGGERR